METRRCNPLVLGEGEDEVKIPQHSHRCSWCKSFFGEFADADCVTGHKHDRCCRECEQEDEHRFVEEA